MGGKVLVPDVASSCARWSPRASPPTCSGVPTVLVARTDADSAKLLTSDVDPRDRAFLTGKRTSEGFFEIKSGVETAIARGLAYAPYADMVWCETSTPDLAQARRFAEGVHAKFPGKLLAYNCSPSFNWKKHLDDATIAKFQRELGAMGYKFQFVTLAGFHALNHGMFELARDYGRRGMAAYSELQQREFASEDARLHGDAPPARGRHRLLRPGGAGGLGRPGLDARPGRVDRGRAVLTPPSPPGGAVAGGSMADAASIGVAWPECAGRARHVPSRPSC